MKTTQLLAPLRAERDTVFESLERELDDWGLKIAGDAMRGNVEQFYCVFYDDDTRAWSSHLHKDFYEVCCEIKQLEAKIYDEAMKAR